MIEQKQIIRELKVQQEHLDELDTEIMQVVEHCREGQVLTSIPPIGPIQAATVVASIGHIDNFESAAEILLRLGSSSGPIGKFVGQIQADASWNSNDEADTLPDRRECYSEEGLRMGQALRTAGPHQVPLGRTNEVLQRKTRGHGSPCCQITEMIYALLKKDAELLSKVPKGQEPDTPTLYDQAIHQAHRQGEYRSLKGSSPTNKIVQLPKQS